MIQYMMGTRHFRAIFPGMALLFAAGLANCAKILLIPAPIHSHCMEVCVVGGELLKRGHEVTAYVISDFNTKDCPESLGIRVIKYKYILGPAKLHEFEHRYARMVLGNHTDVLDSFQLLNEAQNNTCWPILADQDGFVKLQHERFDFAITDGFYTFACYMLIPYKLKIPYAVVSSLLTDFPSTRPFLPNIKPHPFTHFTDDMSFSQRIVNTAVTIIPYYLGVHLAPMEIINRFAPELSGRDVMDLVSKSELFLENTDPILGYPFPLMPNIVQVGGLTAAPPKPLTSYLEHFYEEANDVIVVSFGSAFQLPEEIIDKFMQTFHMLDIPVIWKTADEGRSGKILKTKWMPQNDVLGHAKTRLIIYHCGNNGLYEALYHAIPIICIPLLVDQYFHAERVKRWKVGKVIDIKNFAPEELAAAVTDVLTHSAYKTNMKKISEIYHSRPDTARERAAFWIEHVIRYGGDHIRSKVSDMPMYQYLLLDIYAFFFAIFSIVAYLTYTIFSCIVRRCCCTRLGKKQKSKYD